MKPHEPKKIGLVSVLIPTLNRAAFLGDALRSAMSQALASIEIIVVDDGSDDDTAQVVRGFGERVRYFHQANAGKSAALNLGLSVAQGDAIIVLDDDDLLPDGALQAHVDALNAAPGAGFSYGRFTRFRGDVAAASLSTDVGEMLQDDRRLVIRLMESCFLPNPTWMIRRDAMLATGPYDTSLRRGMDFDMVLRIARRHAGVFVDRVTLYQRKHVSLRRSLVGARLTEHTRPEWIEYDRIIIRRIFDDWSLDDFRPYDNTAGPEDQRLIHLQRAVVLFVRKLYDLAQSELDSYAARPGPNRASPRELQVLGGLFSSDYGLDEFYPRGERYSRWLRSLKLPLSSRLAMASGIRRQVRRKLREGRLGDAARILGFAWRGFGVIAVGEALSIAASILRNRVGRIASPPSLSRS